MSSKLVMFRKISHHATPFQLLCGPFNCCFVRNVLECSLDDNVFLLDIPKDMHGS